MGIKERIKERIVNRLSELDLLILTLFNSGRAKPIRDELFFQKEMFLTINFIKELKNLADFIPHSYGPYSEPAEISLKNLMSVGLIERTPDGFKITDFGKMIAEEVCGKVTTEKREAIDDFKNFLNDLSKDELLVFTYFSYPEMRKESAVFERVKKKRIPASISLYNKGKISLEKAAFLSGLSIENFIGAMKGG